MPTPSPIDDAHMRAHKAFRLECLDDPRIKGRVLEIGPDPEHRKGTHEWETLDVVPGCTFKADICSTGTVFDKIGTSLFDTVLCLDVLEHVLVPHKALKSIRMLLRDGGWLIGSTPFNARIHGPLPDLWRFSNHALRLMLLDWDDVKIEALNSDRPLFPIGYRWQARCNKMADRNVKSIKWERE